MAKVEITLPEHFAFSTEIEVLMQHINRANHLANEHLIALLNEARTRFTQSLKLEKHKVKTKDFINADLAVIYKAEGHHGDILVIEVAAQDFSKYGCDYVYRVSKKDSGQLVALAKTAMLYYDYEQQSLKTVPSDFPSFFA